MRIPFSSARPYLAGFGLVFLLQTAFFMRGTPGGAGVQPIAFNHSKHIAAGLGCTDCHTAVQTEEHATVPSIAICMGCHESALTKSPEEAKLRAFGATGKEPPWRPVTHVPTHVYFSHRRHVSIAKLECVTCHGAMAKLTSPPQRPLVAIAMDSCIGCHQQKQARTDCNDCHR
jgi:predicted CXXCH cytochrome family protein